MLAEYIDGGLEPRERAKVEEHLAECGECYENFAETVRATGVVAEDPGVPVAPHRRWDWRGLTAIAATVTVVAVGMSAWLWLSPDMQRSRALTKLAAVSEQHGRFSPGRLSIEGGWAAASGPVRGESTERPTAVRAAAVAVETLTEGSAKPADLHARGVAQLALGNADSAARLIKSSIDQLGSEAPAEAYADLAAALLTTAGATGSAEDLAGALNQANLSLARRANYLPALFSRAVAAEQLGPPTLAIQAWEDYLKADSSSRWALEAQNRVRALKAPKTSRTTEATQLLQLAERSDLPAWATAVLSNQPADDAKLARLGAQLSELSADRELTTMLVAASRSSDGPASARQALARAILAQSSWLAHYERSETSAAKEDAKAQGVALASAGLPTIGAASRLLLVTDRNEAFASARNLADEAESQGYLRASSLLRISRGSTALRKTLWSEALEDYGSGLDLAMRAADWELIATANALLADGYRDLGDLPEAWKRLQAGLVGVPLMRNSRLSFTTLRAVTEAAAASDLPSAGLEYSSFLAESMNRAGHAAGELLARLNQADAWTQRGDYAQASNAVVQAQRLLPRVKDKGLQDECDAEIALTLGALQAQTSPAQAVDSLSKTLKTFEGQSTVSRIATVLLTRGRAFARQGMATEAEADWSRGASMVADDDLKIRDSQLRISRRDAIWDIFGELTAAQIGRPDEALATVEATRSRELMDSLGPTQRVERLKGAALWNWLPPTTTALVYAVLDHELLVWHIEGVRITLRREAISAARLTALVNAALPELRADGGANASELSRRLLGPLSMDKGTLLVIPDGAVHRVPFSALPFRAAQRRLVETLTPVVAPSLATAHALSSRSRAAGPALVVGYDRARPSERLSYLPGIAQELARVRQIHRESFFLSDETATPSSVMAMAAESAFVHIAAHGIANETRPAWSRLELAGTAANHELRPAEIAAGTLRLHPVVVLSSCESAAGRSFRGEGQMTIARSFLAAGASGVVAAFWSIDDATAADVVVDIHRGLLKGLSAAEAVAAAQRQAITQKIPANVWAAFVVTSGTFASS